MPNVVDITSSDAVRGADGSGGLSVSREMLALVNKAGYLTAGTGAQSLRNLFRNGSQDFKPELLKQFALNCFFGQIQEVKAMVESGRAPDLSGTETPFKFGYCTLVVMGSQRGAADISGGTERFVNTLKFLLAHGAPTDVEDVVGHIVLHHSAQYCQGCTVVLMRMLLAAGANPNHRNKYGEVPIFSAFQANTADAVELLMEYGADLDIADAEGTSPRSIFLSAGPQVTAAVMKWLRKRSGEEMPMAEGKVCHNCGKIEGKLNICSRCHTAWYCSKDCQRVDWPNHKRTCKSYNESNAVTVRPFYNSTNNLQLLPTADVVRDRLNISMTPAQARSSAQVPRVRPGEAKMLVVKVQAPYRSPDMQPRRASEESGDLLVYDKKRSLTCRIRKAENGSAYMRILRTVREKGIGGLKAYFPAELKSKDELVVKVGEVLAEQPF
ncbi:uncharacterized protein FIBRA_08052 [Fibroporia radiculosa]|uniref:MYND-type domain-containing protein n=1 Tax=Fibroporia radiculosa TaxID=599839 RepID=J4GGB3_9APHY|nr:uncharacterized protein FIBRA_08052 [Fibroporia radiculosa]CCM05818.1 predicted protein [Fibroporia radiculosa]